MRRTSTMTDDHAHMDHEMPAARPEQHPASMHTPAESTSPPGGHAGGHDHGGMIADYWRRFVISVILTIPILALTPEVQALFGVEFSFPGQPYVVFLLASLVYFYGGWPFLVGFAKEIQTRQIGMMTLIALAITVAYVYSAAVVLGFAPGMGFFWELATLIDIMLLGHYIEMRSVLGASRALEALVRIMPSEAHLVREGGIVDVPVSDLVVGDAVLFPYTNPCYRTFLLSIEGAVEAVSMSTTTIKGRWLQQPQPVARPPQPDGRQASVHALPDVQSAPSAQITPYAQENGLHSIPNEHATASHQP